VVTADERARDTRHETRDTIARHERCDARGNNLISEYYDTSDATPTSKKKHKNCIINIQYYVVTS
jgi:hypothetical protein